MNRRLLQLILALVATLTAVQPTWAFVEDTPPTFGNGGVDPRQSGDPPAVAAAQRILEEFFLYTNRVYAERGFANPWLMREEVGNRQTDWLNKTLPLACGRLVSGWKNMNWVPGRGWQHELPPRAVRRGANVPCEFTAPTLATAGVDPRLTADPAAVAAAQQALDQFYRETNLSYSLHGYTNPWTMREALGNDQSAWLDMTLPLARAQLVGGWRNMNWVVGQGWRHEAGPFVSVGRDWLPQVAGGEALFAWTANPKAAAPLPEIVARTQRTPPAPFVDPEALRIMQSLEVELGGEYGR